MSSNYDFTPKNVRERVEHTYEIQVLQVDGGWRPHAVLRPDISREQARDQFERTVAEYQRHPTHLRGVYRLAEKKIVTTTSHVVMEQEEIV